MQGDALQSSINPNPFFIRRGFNLIPKPLCPLQGRGLTEKCGNRHFSEFWYGSRSLCPTGEPWFPTSLLSPPLGKGLNLRQKKR